MSEKVANCLHLKNKSMERKLAPGVKLCGDIYLKLCGGGTDPGSPFLITFRIMGENQTGLSPSIK